MKTNYILIAVLLCAINFAHAQVSGCTDPLSVNYNPNATVNNGSCTYITLPVVPNATVNLPVTVNETSGLIFWDGSLYTHNDNTNTNLYGLNITTGVVNQTLAVTGTTNQDWEDIDQDENYIYIAETGNNVNGNRTNLRIIRADKAGLLSGSPTINSINFSYSNQTSFAATSNNNTDFDCEAIIVGTDSIYLFTKQWVSSQTSVYSLPKTPGTHVAQLVNTYNVNGLVTGATYLEDEKLIALSGYSSTLQPFIYLLYDYNGTDFFSGNKRKINLNLPFHQVEGITTTNGTDFYLTNENFQQFVINVPQRLHHFNLSAYLENYLDDIASANNHILMQASIYIYPNPVSNILNIQGRENLSGTGYTITNVQGRQVAAGSLTAINNTIDVAALSSGMYVLTLSGNSTGSYKLVKQ